VKRFSSNNDSEQSLKQNYETVIGLTFPDVLFEGSCNYLQTIEDD
jgi:hypothetical protein